MTRQNNLSKAITFLRRNSIPYKIAELKNEQQSGNELSFRAEIEIGETILIYLKSLNRISLKLYTETGAIIPINNETDLSLIFSPELA